MSGLAVAFPYLLALLPVGIGALIYAYLRRGRGVRIPVATLLLLRTLERVANARKKFIPPPRFFLELLAMLVIGCGAAGLYFEGNQDYVAVVLDNSLSMAAVDPARMSDRSVFEQAQDEAISYVESLPLTSTIELFTPSAAMSSGPLSRREAQDVIKQVEVEYVSDQTEQLLSRLSAESRFDQIAAFTDKSFADTSSDKRVRVTSFAQKGLENIAVSDVSMSGDGREIKALLHAFSRNDVAVKVTLDEWSPAGKGKSVVEKTFRIAAGAHEPITLTAPDQGEHSYQLAIAPASAPGQNFVDALKEDNMAWIGAGRVKNEVVLVSDLSPANLGLQKLRHLQFTHVRPEEWRGAQQTSPHIFHRFVPETLPNQNSLFILPPPGNALFPVLAEQQASAVTRWSVAHPIVNYLNVPTLTLKKLLPLKAPGWAQEVISTTNGLGAFSGEYQGKRYAVFGFEIFPYEGKRSPVLSILTLNALRWLENTNVEFERVGAQFSPGPAVTGITYVGGESLWTRGQKEKSVRFPRPGLVEIAEEGKPRVLQAVNFYSDEESDLLAQRSFSVTAEAKPEETKREQRLLTGLIAYLALSLLLLDLLLFRRERRRAV